LSGSGQEKCPECGRPIYADRPSCLYCGYELPLEEKRKLELKKDLVSKSLGLKTPLKTETATLSPEAGICPACAAAARPGAKFCPKCGAEIKTPRKQTATADKPQKKTPAPFQKLETFIRAKTETAPPVAFFTPGNICWLAAAIFFIIASRIPLGAIRVSERATGAEFIQYINFPAVLWAVFIPVIGLMILSIMNAGFPGGGVQSRQFKLSFLAAITLITLVILPWQLVISAWDLIFVYLVMLAIILHAGKRGTFYESFEPYSAATLICGVYFLLVTISLKSKLLAKTGFGPGNNAGFCLLLLFSIGVILGSFLNRRKTAGTQARE